MLKDGLLMLNICLVLIILTTHRYVDNLLHLCVRREQILQLNFLKRLFGICILV